MNTKTAVGVAAVAVIAVTVGVVAGMTLVGGPADDTDDAHADVTPTATATATATPTATPVLTTVSSTTTPRPTPTPTPEGPVSRTAVEYHIYERVNFHRASYGYDSLRLNESLRAVARNHSEAMAEERSLAIEGSSDQELTTRLEESGVDCQSSTETVGRVPFDTPVDSDDGTTVRYDTPKKVASAIVREWMRGEGTRSQILRIEWVDVGIGVHVVERGDGTMVYATQDLCER